MRLILLGAEGLLGGAVCEQLGVSHEIARRDLADYDIRDRGAFERDLAEVKPDAAINAAAYTNVDGAEDEVELAMEINGEAPGGLARACRERGVRFIHIGTDYVFPGGGERPYCEDDPTGPINAYGRSKLVGEERVMEEHPEGSAILRTSWLFGHGGTDFVRTMLDKFKAGERRFKVVSDQWGRPTYSIDLARAVGACLEKGLAGIYHAANAGETNWRDFAVEIFAAAGVGAEVEVEPVSSSEFPTRAKRPRYSVLDTGKFEGESGFGLPHHRDALKRYVQREGLS